MGKNKKNLCLYTMNYPYGKGEQFIETEIDFLSNEFNKVYIFPTWIDNDKRIVPDNVEIVILPNLEKGYNTFNGLKLLRLNDFFVFAETLKKNGYKNIIRSISETLRLIYSTKKFFIFLNKKKLILNTVHYTYWFDVYSTKLSILKRKSMLDGYVSRAHGFDVYNFRNKLGFIPYRKLHLRYVDKVYCASKSSMNYLLERFPKYTSKIDYAHLGVNDNGTNIKTIKNVLNIVSVSNVITLKRVCRIIDVLKQIEIRVTWTHFGDGEQMKELKKRINELPENIEVVLKGHVPNERIIKFYTEQPVDLFIHLSETEGGVPVSIQEACSFGIPIIATDVGGISEIVNKKTGKLVNAEINELVIIKFLESFNKSIYSTELFRIGVKKFWFDNFNAQINYIKFIKRITNGI